MNKTIYDYYDTGWSDGYHGRLLGIGLKMGAGDKHKQTYLEGYWAGQAERKSEDVLYEENFDVEDD